MAMIAGASLLALVGVAVAGATGKQGRHAKPRATTAFSLRGASLYRAHCARCHGAEGRGGGPDAALFMPPPRDLGDRFLDHFSTDDLVARVRKSKPLRLTIDPAALRARASEVSAIVAHLERLPSMDWTLVERGEEIYVDRCEICHGPFGRGPAEAAGVTKPPRDLSEPSFQKANSDRQIETIALHGRGSMPGIPGLHGRPDLGALIAFVRVLSPGYEMYSRYCASCHGDDGRGAGSFAESKPLPSVIFDRHYLRTADPEELRRKLWHMLDQQSLQMPHFAGELSQRDVRAIIVYLKQRS
jgi:mono/diheme cytochrome c family protein